MEFVSVVRDLNSCRTKTKDATFLTDESWDFSGTRFVQNEFVAFSQNVSKGRESENETTDVALFLPP